MPIDLKNYYVYILKCADSSYYTGIRNNLERRLAEHESGINPDCYTYKRRPVELVYSEYFTDPNLAIAFEKKVKNWSKAKKTALIEKNWEKLKSLSICHNASHFKNIANKEVKGKLKFEN